MTGMLLVPYALWRCGIRAGGLALLVMAAVGGGIGAMQGQILRIGLMGVGSTETNVMALLFALETQLRKQGFKLDAGAGLKAAAASYAKE